MVTWTVEERYGGVVEFWSVRLALARIRRFGFPRHEWPDRLQELVLEIMAFKFDPAKANGASKTTAVCGLINKRLVSAWRATQRYERRIARLRPEECYSDQAGLRLDVRTALANLPPRERSVGEGICRGQSVSEIARALGCGRATVRRLRENIRQRFMALRLDAWVLS